MRVFKWDSEFTPFKESPIAPLWIRIEGLSLYMFDEKALLSLANSIGKPIRVDPKNINRVNLSSARICVELDVSQPLVDSIWVRFEDEISKEVLEGFWVRVYYDVVPPFCTICSHICHGLESCKRRPGKRNKRDAHKVFETLSQPGEAVQCFSPIR
ncbi:hypothetical protein LIER_39628 [Lithospermum erythrorhizon]|uniref:DUF4283 domain-containing protein n=1 Tax=Lithospermum erythrorhizon TaxID=34254 RepID=A0AAV3QM23_LITER